MKIISTKFSRLLVGVGALLWIVPLTIMIVTLVKADYTSAPIVQLAGFMWCLVVAYAMLPLGLGMFLTGLGFLALKKRASGSCCDSKKTSCCAEDKKERTSCCMEEKQEKTSCCMDEGATQEQKDHCGCKSEETPKVEHTHTGCCGS